MTELNKGWENEPYLLEVLEGKKAPLSKTPVNAAALKDLEQRIRNEIADPAALSISVIRGSHSPKEVSGVPDVINVKDFLAQGDGITNDLAALQDAHDALPESGGVLYFPPGEYVVQGSVISGGMIVGLVIWKDNVTLAGPGEIVQPEATEPHQRTVIVAGGGKANHSDPISKENRDIYQTLYVIEPAAEGSNTLQCVTPSDASHFAVGDDIYIRTGSLVDGAGNITPDAEYNIVAKADAITGVITLQWPTIKPYAQEYWTSGKENASTDTTDHGFGKAPLGVSNMTAKVVRNFKCLIAVNGHVESDYSVYIEMATDIVVRDFRVKSLGAGIAGGRSFRGFRFSDISAYREVGGSTARENNWFAPSTGCSDGLICDNILIGEVPRKMHAHEGIADLTVRDNIIKTKSIESTGGPSIVSPKARAYRHKWLDNTIIGAFTNAPIASFNSPAVACEFKRNRIYTLPSSFAYVLQVTNAAADWAIEGNTFPAGSALLNESTLARFRNNVNCSLDIASWEDVQRHQSRLDKTIPTGYLGEFISRDRSLTSLTALTSGKPILMRVFVKGGQKISKIRWFSAGTAGAGLTHCWAGLVASNGKTVLAKSADNVEAEWGKNTDREFVLSEAYTPSSDGFIYVMLCVAGETMPTLMGVTHNAAFVNNKPPIPLGKSGTAGLTTPASCPAELATMEAVAIAGMAYGLWA